MLLAIEGVDGAGKTTQCLAVSTALASHGIRTKTVINRSSALLEYLRAGANMLKRLDATDWLGQQTVRELLCLDFGAYMQAHELCNADAASTLEPVILMDRSIYCQLAVSIRDGATNLSRIRDLMCACPSPKTVIYLEISPAVAESRVRSRGTDEESVCALYDLDVSYRRLPEFDSFICLNGEQDQETVTVEIVDVVLDVLAGQECELC